MYAMYLRKSRADKELEALGEGETLRVVHFTAEGHAAFYRGLAPLLDA